MTRRGRPCDGRARLGPPTVGVSALKGTFRTRETEGGRAMRGSLPSRVRPRPAQLGGRGETHARLCARTAAGQAGARGAVSGLAWLR